ncbi:hypothetical protein [Bradyrhizobium erythrophlei]|jgi:hypothetical protein|uniref:Uncharacterized protein n=1 Tax=Bradyrhizobium erythrophlei TaxID=1437360 RepID=A0A1M7TXM1_9BRAD|nr:hypothetical protein [Bradyrhizobium erythrophlei]SHN75440.1 hypothetical protein SAMN05444170_2959 [Bradyrhizobium erythrophlei]
MSGSRSAILLMVFGVLLTTPVLPRLAHAQSVAGDSLWTVLDVTNAINATIEESKEGVEMREKAVRRFSECSLMYGGLSTMTSNTETRKNYVTAQQATAEIEFQLAKPLQQEKRLELETAARQSVAMMLRTVKAEGTKEIAPLLKSCKALNDSREVRGALQALLQN